MSSLGLLLNNGSARQGSSSLLEGMLSNPIEFGPPIYGQSTAFDKTQGVRIVPSGPSSPPRSYSTFNGHSTTPSRTPKQEPIASSSRITIPLENKSLTTPTRKGKEPQHVTPDGTSEHVSPLNSTIKTPNGTALSPLHYKDLELSWPSELRNAQRSGAGLYNPSMACYANATLQVILHTPPATAMIIKHVRETKNEGCAQARKGYCAVCALGTLLVKHWKSNTNAYPPKEIHSNLSHIKKGFNRNRQEDSHEFFRFLVDSIQATALSGYSKNLPEKLKHTTWVHRLWGGRIRSRVVCSRCKKPSDTFDNFLDLSLDVNRKGSAKLESMLHTFCKEESLDGENKYKCDSCKAKANAVKFFRIAQAPPVLTFHLKRFNVSLGYGGRARTEKYRGYISFPERIDIAPYMVKTGVTNTKYRLFAVTCHHGAELRFGHYTSYVKAPNGRWYHADDEDMSSVTIDEVLRDHSAYILSYIRCGPDGFDAERAQTSTPTPSKINGKAEYPWTGASDGVDTMQKSIVNGTSSQLPPTTLTSPLRGLSTTSASDLGKRPREPATPPPDLPSSLPNGATSLKTKNHLNGSIHDSTFTPPPSSPMRSSQAADSDDGTTASKFGYKKDPITKPLSEFKHSMDGPPGELSWKVKNRSKEKNKKKRSHGAPMPFKQQSMGNGGKSPKNFSKGMIGRMKSS